MCSSPAWAVSERTVPRRSGVSDSGRSRKAVEAGPRFLNRRFVAVCAQLPQHGGPQQRVQVSFVGLRLPAYPLGGLSKNILGEGQEPVVVGLAANEVVEGTEVGGQVAPHGNVGLAAVVFRQGKEGGGG